MLLLLLLLLLGLAHHVLAGMADAVEQQLRAERTPVKYAGTIGSGLEVERPAAAAAQSSSVTRVPEGPECLGVT
jgi:hypothetical protein